MPVQIAAEMIHITQHTIGTKCLEFAENNVVTGTVKILRNSVRVRGQIGQDDSG